MELFKSQYVLCLDNFYSLSGDIIFEKGMIYKIKSNGIIENKNYHLHYSECFSKIFQEQYKNV